MSSQSLYKTLHRLNADEVDRLVAVCPTSAALEATDWAGNIFPTRAGQDCGLAFRTLFKYVGRKNPHNIGVVLSSNLDLFVAASDQYVSPLCRQKDGTYEEGVVPPVFYHGDTVLDAPLALFRHGVTPARLSWVFNLWTGTHTGPSVEGCVGAMFTQPDLLLLLLTGPPDGSGDAQLVAAAEFAIAAQAVPAVLTDRSPYWMTGVVKRILSNTPVRSQLLRNFLMGVDPTVKQFLAGKFPGRDDKTHPPIYRRVCF
jgi:hypothetical protein